jgi:hypothetical protein
MEKPSCFNCADPFIPSPRQKNQKYCGKPECQRARKTAWQRYKMAIDPDYRLNQKESNREWIETHRDYWRRYRKKHPQKTRRNRLLQAIRNNRRHKSENLIAKMDALKPRTFKPLGQFYLVPLIAKMDALKVNITEISDSQYHRRSRWLD